MPKKLGDLSDRVRSHWFPKGKSSHAGAGRKTRRRMKRDRGETQSNEDVV